MSTTEDSLACKVPCPEFKNTYNITCSPHAADEFSRVLRSPGAMDNCSCSSSPPAHFSAHPTHLFLQKPPGPSGQLSLFKRRLPRRGQRNQQLKCKSFVTSCMQLNEAHQEPHRPSSLQCAMRAFQPSPFSDALKQKSVLRALPYVAFCLTHKPTCKVATAVHKAPPETVKLCGFVSPQRESICGGEVAI